MGLGMCIDFPNLQQKRSLRVLALEPEDVGAGFVGVKENHRKDSLEKSLGTPILWPLSKTHLSRRNRDYEKRRARRTHTIQ